VHWEILLAELLKTPLTLNFKRGGKNDYAGPGINEWPSQWIERMSQNRQIVQESMMTGSKNSMRSISDNMARGSYKGAKSRKFMKPTNLGGLPLPLESCMESGM
jgi:hypothetical protein